MNIIISILNIAGLLFVAWLLYRIQPRQLKKFYWPALCLKIFCGIALGWVYFYFYEGIGDTVTYYHEAQVLSNVAFSDFERYLHVLFSGPGSEQLNLSSTTPRAFFFLKLVSISHILTGGNYWLMSCYFSLVSFMASWFFVKTIYRNLSQFTLAAMLSVLFLPSAVFWSSGVIKESVASASLFYLSGVVVLFWFGRRINWLQWVLALVAFWLLWSLKYHYAAIFLAGVATLFIFRFIGNKIEMQSLRKAILVWIALLIAPIILVTLIHPNFEISRIASVVVENNLAFHKLSDEHDLVQFYRLSPDISSLVMNAPWACISGIFRPFIWESNNVLQIASGVESMVLLVVAIVAFFRLRPDMKVISFGFAMLTFILLLSTFITLSTPNFGTLSRYRVGYLPYFALLLMSVGPVGSWLQRKSLVLFDKP